MVEVVEVAEVLGQNPNLLIFGKTLHPTKADLFASSKKWSISFAIDGAEIWTKSQLVNSEDVKSLLQ